MADSRSVEEELVPYFELKPFEVVGEEIPITVYARSGSDRRYATKFAHSVIEVVYVTLEKSPGSGLVIMGDEGEPHPTEIMDRFMAFSKRPEASDSVKALGREVEEILANWEVSMRLEMADGEDVPFKKEQILKSLPMGLDGVMSRLYLMAWEERFDYKKAEGRFEELGVVNGKVDPLEEYDWVFYLPPRNAFDQVIKDVLAEVMKKEKVGFFKRTLIRGAVATFKPVIRDFLEGMRKGMLYNSVMDDHKEYSEGDIRHLTERYFESQMPKGRVIPGGKVKRGIEAVEQAKRENEEYAKDPFVPMSPLGEYDRAKFEKYLGQYDNPRGEAHQFYFEDGWYQWKYLDHDPRKLTPAGPEIFVSEDGKMTLEILKDEDGRYATGLQKWDNRFRELLTRPVDQVE